MPDQYLEHSGVHKIHKVKVITRRSKATGPKFYACAHLPVMGSPQAKIGHININTLDIGGSKRFARSWLQGQRSQDRNSMPKHIYPSQIVHRYKLATLASIPWTHGGPQESQGQDHGSKVEGHRTKIPCSCISTPHGWSTDTVFPLSRS